MAVLRWQQNFFAKGELSVSLGSVSSAEGMASNAIGATAEVGRDMATAVGFNVRWLMPVTMLWPLVVSPLQIKTMLLLLVQRQMPLRMKRLPGAWANRYCRKA